METFTSPGHAGDIHGAGVGEGRSLGARFAFAIAAASCAIVLLSLAVAHVGNARTAPLAFHGVRLGLAPQDVRSRFALGGTWTSVPADELTLVWSSSEPLATVREARFEFHLGSLVALRGRVTSNDEGARGEALRVSEAALLAREVRRDGLVNVVLVARDCPTHAKEVARLLERQ